MLQNIKQLSKEQLVSFVLSVGQPKFRASQIYSWLWIKHAKSFEDMSDLPLNLRQTLAENFYLHIPRPIVTQQSADGSRKYLLELADKTTVECVGMPSLSKADKLSICVSSQAGCAMRCSFCATGKSGLIRSLTADEIYEQAQYIIDDFGMRASNIVFMGQGEPFTNYRETLRTLRLFNARDGLGIGARHLTVSTCGIIPMIRKFATEPEQFTLAVSLHSAVQKTRDELMPGVKQFKLTQLKEALQNYAEKTGRRPSYEYALIGGVNDTDEEISALCDFTRGTLVHVNFIMLNEIDDSPFKPSTPERAQLFIKRLARVGVEATIRNSRGSDIDAACGQLKQKSVARGKAQG